jgi:ATP synthase F1 complex assembly factor 2
MFTMSYIPFPGTYWITLDGRPLRTPSGARLAVPENKKILALLIANEWENQKEALKAPGLPMTSLASRALDGFESVTNFEGEINVREGVLNELFRYLDTDTTL